MAAAMAGTSKFSGTHKIASLASTKVSREIVYNWLAIAFELITSIAVTNGLARILLYRIERHDSFLIAADLLFFLCLGCLMSGSLVYQVTRLGYLLRLRDHSSLTLNQLESVYDGEKPRSLAVLVPSYREEEAVVRRTLMSAALAQSAIARLESGAQLPSVKTLLRFAKATDSQAVLKLRAA